MKDLILRLLLKALQSLLTDELIEQLKDDAVEYLRELAKSTENELDDALVDIVARALD